MAASQVSSMLEAVGGTPVVRLGGFVPPDCADIVVKLEWYNPTGSYKDRMALSMVEGAEKRGELRPGMTVVEFTGGSTGSSLAYVCAAKGYGCHLVSSDAFAEEKLRTMRAFGAEVTVVPSEQGRITPDLIPRMRREVERLAGRPDTYFTDQFHNADQVLGYRRLGEELLAQVDPPFDLFCASVGTAGMLSGVARAVRAAGGPARIVALEPASSAVISTGEAGAHHVEGIGVGFVPPLFEPDLSGEARGIEEETARATARRLAREEGLFAGTSSGLNVAGALHLARELGPGHTVATVAVDTGLKYLTGDLYQ